MLPKTNMNGMSGYQRIAARRLCNQHINQQLYKKPVDVVKWLGAVQAQNYTASLWAVALRSQQVTEEDVEQSIAEKAIVRTWPMRGTLHLVPAEDIRWMLRLLTPRIIKGSAGRYRQLELDETVFTKSRKVLEEALQGEKKLTRPELYQVLEQAGISTATQRGYHILSYLAQTEVICFGPRRNKQFAFVLLDEWVSSGKSLEGDEALAKLAKRYFRSRGPATVYDFAWWSGLKISEARAGLEMVKPDLEQETLEEKTYWFPLSASAVESNSDIAYLLPAFDEYLLGYTDRSAILDSARARDVYTANGIFRPAIVVNGRVAGIWKRKLGEKSVSITVNPFTGLTDAGFRVISAAADLYGEFLNKPVTVVQD